MFAKSIKKNGHYRVGRYIPHEGVDLGEVSADELALLKADASIVLSETPFEPAAEVKVSTELEAQAKAEAQAKVEAKAEAEAKAKKSAGKK